MRERTSEGGRERRVQEEEAAKRSERQDRAEPVKGRENNVDVGDRPRWGIYKRVGENSHDTRVALSEGYRCADAAAHAA